MKDSGLRHIGPEVLRIMAETRIKYDFRRRLESLLRALRPILKILFP